MLREAIRIKPTDVEYWMSMKHGNIMSGKFNGGAIIFLNEFKQAFDYYDQVISLNPIFVKQAYSLGGSVFRAQECQDATFYFGEGTQQQSKTWMSSKKGIQPVINLSGLTLLQNLNYQDAIISTDGSFMLKPADADYYRENGVTINKQMKILEAIKFRDQAFNFERRINLLLLELSYQFTKFINVQISINLPQFIKIIQSRFFEI